MTRSGRLLLAGAAAAIAALSLIPLVNLIPDDLAAPWYGATVRSWLVLSALVAAIGLGLAVLSRRVPGLWREGAGARIAALADPASLAALGAVAAVAGLAYLAVALLVFDGRALHIDEIVQLLSARSYAAGRVAEPADLDPAFRTIMHLVEREGRVFGHFPPGGPAWLALGELIHLPWLAGPLAGALAVLAFGLVLRVVEPTPAIRGAALLLFAFAPFVLFMAGSHMNHAPALMWALFGVAAMLRAGAGPPPNGLGLAARGRWILGLAGGLAFGMAAATRPPDALAWAGAAGLWLLSRRALSARLALGGLVGLAVPIAAVLAVNAATTGAPFRFAYELAWGPGVGLGFHDTPWGPGHTPLRGLELLNLYLLRLNVYLFEAPVPGLVPALVAIAFSRRLERGDGLLLGAAALLLGVYFAYWHDGFYLGPRFVYGLVPVAALWTARLPSRLAPPGATGWARRRALAFAGIATVAITAAVGIPERARQHARGLAPLRWDADEAADQAGVRNAVVFVQESWGAQLLARLLALGVPAPAAERVYRNLDTCRLEEAVTALEAESVRGLAAVERLVPLMADSARLVPSTLSPDRTERMLPGATYGRVCVQRFREDQAGMTLLAPQLLSRRPDLLFVRNLHERNAGLLARHPGKAVFLLTQRTGAPVPEFVPLSRDSILASGR